MGKSFFNGTDAQLNTGSPVFSAQITSTPGAFGLVAGQAAAYSALSVLYTTAYTTAMTPATRTKGTIIAKNVAKKNLKAMASDLAKIIDGTPTVTDTEKVDLGLSVRATPTPVPVPPTAPKIDVVSAVGRTVNLRLHDSTNGSKRGKPVNVNGACVYSYVGTTPPDDTNAWTFEGVTSVTKFPVQFPTSVAAGAQVWFTAFWFNERKQNGPAADRVTINIPGGSVTIAA